MLKAVEESYRRLREGRKEGWRRKTKKEGATYSSEVTIVPSSKSTKEGKQEGRKVGQKE